MIRLFLAVLLLALPVSAILLPSRPRIVLKPYLPIRLLPPRAAQRFQESWPVGNPEANPNKTRFLFSGLRQDIAIRRPTYVADWVAGFRRKTIGATLFLYFACLAPVIAFGGAMQVATCGQLGIVETILSRGVCGMLYATLAGQPMTFIGSHLDAGVFARLI